MGWDSIEEWNEYMGFTSIPDGGRKIKGGGREGG